jgi:hypothetical protein
VALQNEFGQIENLNYKDAVTNIGCSSNTTFYSCLYALESKGLIRMVNTYCNNWGYFDIEILDNEFRSAKDLKKGYINLNLNIFANEAYKSSTVKVKVFVMKLIIRLSKLKAVYFDLDQVKSLVGVTTTKIAKQIVEAIKKWFRVVKNQGTYIISKREGFFTPGIEAAENKGITYRISNFLKRFKIGFGEADLKELLSMFKQFGKSWGNMLYALWECKRYETVQLKLVNKILDIRYLIY